MFRPKAGEQGNKKKSIQNVAKLGTNWNNGLKAGAFYLNLNNVSSNRNRNNSRQLVNARNMPPLMPGAAFSIILCIPERPCHRAKHNNKINRVGKVEIKFSKVEDSV